MRKLRRLLMLATLLSVGYAIFQRVRSSSQHPDFVAPPQSRGAPPAGRDTPTGTDPSAKYTQPGYEDKSFGQAVNADQELVERLVDEAGGDLDAAEARFNETSSGAPVLARQSKS